MRILVTGSSGFVGAALLPLLEERGHETVRLVRREPRAGAGELRWGPRAGTIDTKGLEGVEAVIHLAGENIADGRWNAAKKERLRASRVDATRLLVTALSELSTPPRCLVAASAVGFYGDRGDEVLEEDAPAGEGFLPKLWRGLGGGGLASRPRRRCASCRLASES